MPVEKDTEPIHEFVLLLVRTVNLLGEGSYLLAVLHQYSHCWETLGGSMSPKIHVEVVDMIEKEATRKIPPGISGFDTSVTILENVELLRKMLDDGIVPYINYTREGRPIAMADARKVWLRSLRFGQ